MKRSQHAWLQATFYASYHIVTNDGWHANLDMNKPLTPQLKQALIDLKQGKTEKPEVLKYAEKDKEILEKMKADVLKYGTAPPWFNEVDPKKPPFPQVQAFNERQAAKKRARKQQQEQDGIENDWADSADSG